MTQTLVVTAGQLARKTGTTGKPSMTPDQNQSQGDHPDSQTDLQLVRKVRNGDRAAFDLPDHPFDPRMNVSGGEDDVFFLMLAGQGARFAWSVKAHGVEWVDPKRTSWRYLMARSFAFGQGATQTARHAGQPARIAFWMGVGLGQALVFGPLAALAALVAPGKAAALLDKAIQGTGKLFWIEAFEPRFYGQSVAAPS